MKKRLVVRYDVNEGRGAEFLEALLTSEAVKNVRNEKGNLQYEYFVSAENPDKIILLELWESEEDLKAHIAGPNMAPIGEIKKLYTKATTIEKYDKKED